MDLPFTATAERGGPGGNMESLCLRGLFPVLLEAKPEYLGPCARHGRRVLSNSKGGDVFCLSESLFNNTAEWDH